ALASREPKPIESAAEQQEPEPAPGKQPNEMSHGPSEMFSEAAPAPEFPSPKFDIAPSIVPDEPAPRPNPMMAKALWLRGTLCDFKREGLLDEQVSEILSAMTPEMLDDVYTLAPQVMAWLQTIGAVS